MERYNYRNAVKEDVKAYIMDNYGEELADRLSDRDEFAELLQDELWTADEVTGNGSGSYFFSTYKAEEAICHNLDLLGEALAEFGCSGDVLANGAEWCDVTIRCYLLGEAISEALAEIENEE